MSLPWFAGREFGWLLDPALGVNHIQLAIAVDITDSKAVAKFLVGNLSRDRSEFPRLEWASPVDGCIAEEAIARAN